MEHDFTVKFFFLVESASRVFAYPVTAIERQVGKITKVHTVEVGNVSEVFLCDTWDEAEDLQEELMTFYNGDMVYIEEMLITRTWTLGTVGN